VYLPFRVESLKSKWLRTQGYQEFHMPFTKSHSPVETNRNADAGQAIFQARQLCKTYTMGEMKVHALRNVDLDLYKDEFVVLLGASGSAKSTLLIFLVGWMCLLAGR
jgi:ABC-type polysaccharide/polyol phosphate transport system ATPase subunit